MENNVNVTNIYNIFLLIRESGIIGILITGAWKLRGVKDDIKSFFERVTEHMDIMEKFAQDAVTNHLSHIERNLEEIASAAKVPQNKRT